MNALDIYAVLLILLAALDWTTVLLLWGSRQRAKERYGVTPATLDERGQAATLIAIGAAVFALLGLNRLFHGPLPADWALAMLLFGIFWPSLANLNWLGQALLGRFGPRVRQDDATIERWYAAFEKVSGYEAKTIEGKRNIYQRFNDAFASQ